MGDDTAFGVQKNGGWHAKQRALQQAGSYEAALQVQTIAVCGELDDDATLLAKRVASSDIRASCCRRCCTAIASSRFAEAARLI